MNLLETLFNIVYPPFCEVCNFKLKKGKLYICNFCLEKIIINSPPFCKKCSRHLSYEKGLCNNCTGQKSYLEQVWSWGVYDDVLKKCIHLFKYKKRIHLIDIFKKPLFEFFKENSILENIDIIVPVPLYIDKLKRRTFNQAQILASIFSKHFNIKLIKDLKKIRATEPQNKLNKYKREINIRDSFAIKEKRNIYKKRILLIDDIYTTGCTLNECASILLEAGAEKIYAFTLARGL